VKAQAHRIVGDGHQLHFRALRAQKRLEPSESFLRAGFEVRGMQAVEQEKIADQAVPRNLLYECAAVSLLAKQLQQLCQGCSVEVEDGLDKSAGAGAFRRSEFLELVHELPQPLREA
jgi:hypothetical protein